MKHSTFPFVTIASSRRCFSVKILCHTFNSGHIDLSLIFSINQIEDDFGGRDASITDK